MYYIYAIQNKSDLKVYIGQTVNPKRRWCDHKWLSKNKPEQYIHRAMIKYGIENFIFTIIDTAEDGYKANELEIDWINWFKSRNNDYGYNIAPGGNDPWNRGLPSEQQPMYGKHHTETSKKQISESNMGKIIPNHTDEWKLNQSKIMTGRIITDEWKEKIAIANKGKTVFKETKQKMSESAKGKIISDITKEKMSIAKLGKSISDITKEKMSNSKSGEKSNTSKLHNDLVIKIIEEYNSNQFTQQELALRYNVSNASINNLLNNKTWKNINKPPIIKVLSDESRNRMSDAHKNKIVSDETRRKMSNVKSGKKYAAKLNWDIVNKIREKYNNGISKEELSLEFSISKINIYYIVTYRTWKI